MVRGTYPVVPLSDGETQLATASSLMHRRESWKACRNKSVGFVPANLPHDLAHSRSDCVAVTPSLGALAMIVERFWSHVSSRKQLASVVLPVSATYV